MSESYDLTAVRNHGSNYDLSAIKNSSKREEKVDILDDVIIVIDSREKKEYNLDSHCLDTITSTLETGDYTIKNCASQYAIERKSKTDFLRSITRDRDRFENEVQRADDFTRPMDVVVEATRTELEEGDYHRDVHSASVEGTIDLWSRYYNIQWHFERNRRGAKQRVLELLADFASAD